MPDLQATGICQPCPTSAADSLISPARAGGFVAMGRPRRERLLAGWAGADAAWASRMAALLLAQDGSATRLCELVAGGPVELVVHYQRELAADALVDTLPMAVRTQLPHGPLIERLVSLQAHGQVMMDNLSWLAPQALPPDIRDELAQGRTPIGHLLARMWIRRVAVPEPELLWPPIWAQIGLPDPSATRSYAIHTHEGGAAMLISECFRRGMLMTRPAPQY